jgi:transcriptional regulator with GAF, ATPase, and Fis domain
MNGPRGCLRVLTGSLMRFARTGDVEGLRAYVASQAFLAAFNGLEAAHRQSALRSYAKAEALCESKSRYPLVHPSRIDAKRAQKASWSRPEERARLAAAYAQANGSDERAARILGVTLGSARLARQRHLRNGPGRPPGAP